MFKIQRIISYSNTIDMYFFYGLTILDEGYTWEYHLERDLLRTVIVMFVLITQCWCGLLFILKNTLQVKSDVNIEIISLLAKYIDIMINTIQVLRGVGLCIKHRYACYCFSDNTLYATWLNENFSKEIGCIVTSLSLNSPLGFY